MAWYKRKSGRGQRQCRPLQVLLLRGETAVQFRGQRSDVPRTNKEAVVIGDSVLSRGTDTFEPIACALACCVNSRSQEFACLAAPCFVLGLARPLGSMSRILSHRVAHSLVRPHLDRFRPRPVAACHDVSLKPSPGRPIRVPFIELYAFPQSALGLAHFVFLHSDSSSHSVQR